MGSRYIILYHKESIRFGVDIAETTGLVVTGERQDILKDIDR